MYMDLFQCSFSKFARVFTIYELWEMPIQCERNDCTDHVLTTCANGSLNETKISESAYLSAAKAVQ